MPGRRRASGNRKGQGIKGMPGYDDRSGGSMFKDQGSEYRVKGKKERGMDNRARGEGVLRIRMRKRVRVKG